MALEGLRLAAGTLTVIPSGPIPEIDRPMAARAMIIAPLAVAPLAVVAAGLSWVYSSQFGLSSTRVLKTSVENRYG